MTARLTFRSAAEYEPGTVYAILAQCYADILDTTLRDSLGQFDREVFAAPDTVGACAFISSVDEQSVGLFSYDPRQGPQIGIIGHSGVLPLCQRRGYDTEQILEIVRLFTLRRFACARVSTSEHPFFIPARRMYEKCGFHVSGRTPGDRSPYGIVHYERPLIG
jgi:ribosomal protein S18 acetylase RimI-like enzyme